MFKQSIASLHRQFSAAQGSRPAGVGVGARSIISHVSPAPARARAALGVNGPFTQPHQKASRSCMDTRGTAGQPYPNLSASSEISPCMGLVSYFSLWGICDPALALLGLPPASCRMGSCLPRVRSWAPVGPGHGARAPWLLSSYKNLGVGMSSSTYSPEVPPKGRAGAETSP